MVTRFRDMIGQKPDGIAMMGHPGDAALMPLAEEATAAGIKVSYMNVDVPEVRAKTGTGFVGAPLCKQGQALAVKAIRVAGDTLKPGDTAIVMSRWEAGNRAQREQGLADALEAFGMTVTGGRHGRSRRAHHRIEEHRQTLWQRRGADRRVDDRSQGRDSGAVG